MPSLISTSDLIDKSWNHYKNAFPAFLQCSGWLAIIALLHVIALLLYPSVGVVAYHSSLSATELTGVILYGIANFILWPLMSFWAYIALTTTASAQIQGKSLSWQEIARASFARFWPALVTAMLVGLMIIWAQVFTLGPAIIIGILGFFFKNAWAIGAANILVIIGLFASAIMTTRWTLSYAMAPYVAILDAQPGKAALAQSKTMVRGSFWPVLLRLLLPKMVFLLFGVLAAFMVDTLIQSFIVTSTGMNLDLQQRIGDLINAVFPILLFIFINPLIFLSDVLLYRSLKEQQSS